MKEEQWIELFNNHESAILTYCENFVQYTVNFQIKMCTIRLNEKLFLMSVDLKELQWIGCFNAEIKVLNPDSIYLEEKKNEKSHSS